MSDAIIRTEGLVREFPMGGQVVHALRGLDLAVVPGEFLCITGPSGSGKSTLLHLIGGLDRPTRGRVLVAGMDLTALDEDALAAYRRRQVGFVFQHFNLISTMTARQNVEFPMIFARVPPDRRRARAAELLTLVGLADRMDHQPSELSGGEQQRVAIAVALANKPVLLLADEPTGEVDSATAQTIFETFHRMNEMLDLTTIIVTHDPRLVGQVDRVVAIRDGKTSTETIRRVSQLEQAMVGERLPEDGEAEEEVTYHEYVVLDSAGRLQVPQEYLELFGIGDRVQLELADEGVLIRPIAGPEGAAGRSAQVSLEDQVAHLFADERPPARRGLLDRLRRRWRK